MDWLFNSSDDDKTRREVGIAFVPQNVQDSFMHWSLMLSGHDVAAGLHSKNLSRVAVLEGLY